MNTQDSETKEFRGSCHSETDSAAGLRVPIVSVWCYRGNVVNPMWADVDTNESPLLSPSRFPRIVKNNAVASSRSTPNNDTTNLSTTSGFIFPNDQSQQQRRQRQSRPMIGPWDPNLFSTSSGIGNGNSGSGGRKV